MNQDEQVDGNGRPMTQDEMKEARSAQADYAVSSWIARQVAAWTAEFAQANPGQPMMIADVAQPVLAGVTAALMRFAWDASAADATPEQVADRFREMAMRLLTPISAQKGSGGLMTIMQEKLN